MDSPSSGSFVTSSGVVLSTPPGFKPAAVPLSGAFQGYTVQTDAPGLLHIHLDIPAILAASLAPASTAGGADAKSE